MTVGILLTTLIQQQTVVGCSRTSRWFRPCAAWELDPIHTITGLQWHTNRDRSLVNIEGGYHRLPEPHWLSHRSSMVDVHEYECDQKLDLFLHLRTVDTCAIYGRNYHP